MVLAQKKVRQIAPHSRPHRLAKLDQRTREARLLATVRADLIKHLGGAPSAVQLALVDRAAMLSLHVAMFDSKALEGGGLSTDDAKKYLAYSNSLARCLRTLGLEPKSTPRRSLADELMEAERAGA